VIAVEGLSIRQAAFALEGVTFTVPTGAYAALMGPTGTGKTTVLEAIAGLRTPTAGRIRLTGRDVTALPPAARNVGYVPQDAALFKTMTVRENLAFALVVRSAPRKEIDARVTELADRLGLTALLGRYAVSLSGGEAQRIALGRALASRPPVLLLDEPLNAVDELTRDRMGAILKDVRSSGETTVLHVTHSQTEADLLGTLLLKIENGRVIEIGA